MDLILMKTTYNRLAILILLLISCISCWAHNYNGHNEELKRILFGNDYYSKVSEKGTINFRLLCEAAYLTLDYKNEPKGSECLADLKNNGIKNLPSIESISFSSNQYHQMYTHFGWEKGCRGFVDKANWEKRKQILLSTVGKIGSFNDNERIKLDAFAALIYEIHILGDHIGDTDQTRDTRIRLVSEPGYRGQVISPTSAGPFNNPTLYTYMLYHIQRLFRDQKDKYEYTQLVGFLNRHKDEFVNSTTTPVPYDDITFLAKQTKKRLVEYIPKLLEREEFFKRAFFRK